MSKKQKPEHKAKLAENAMTYVAMAGHPFLTPHNRGLLRADAAKHGVIIS